MSDEPSPDMALPARQQQQILAAMKGIHDDLAMLTNTVTRLRPVPELGEIRERLNLTEMRHASASRGLDSLSIQANDTDDRLHRLVMERLERKGDATATLVADMRAEPADHTAQITQILQAIKGGR
jgi:hypothetical protein